MYAPLNLLVYVRALNASIVCGLQATKPLSYLLSGQTDDVLKHVSLAFTDACEESYHLLHQVLWLHVPCPVAATSV